MKADKKTILADIDALQTAIGNFIHHGDDYILGMPDATYDIEGDPIRQMQRRLARMDSDLATLYRRLDT